MALTSTEKKEIETMIRKEIKSFLKSDTVKQYEEHITDVISRELKKGKLRGAGLDVHDKEPTIKNDKLNNHPNVVVTPHISGSTYDTYLRVINSCLDNIKNTIKNNKNIKWRV